MSILIAFKQVFNLFFHTRLLFKLSTVADGLIRDAMKYLIRI